MSICEGTDAQQTEKLTSYVKSEVARLDRDLVLSGKVLPDANRLELKTDSHFITATDRSVAQSANTCSQLKESFDATITRAREAAVLEKPELAQSARDRSELLAYEEFLAKQARVLEAQKKAELDPSGTRYAGKWTWEDTPETVVKREMFSNAGGKAITARSDVTDSEKRWAIYRLALVNSTYGKFKEIYLKNQRWRKRAAGATGVGARQFTSSDTSLKAFRQSHDKLSEWAKKFYNDHKAKSMQELSGKIAELEEQDIIVPGTLEQMKKGEEIRKEAELGKSGDFLAESPAAARFREQCYLVHHMDKFTEKAQDHFKARPPKELRILDGDGSTVANKLFSRDVYGLMNITPAQAALLLPIIEIWKVEYPPGKPPIQKPFVFEDHLSNEKVKKILQNSRGRGDGIGIQSVTLDWQGTDMESAERIIMAKIAFFVQSLESFTLPKEPSENIALPIDLITPSKLLRNEDLWVTDKTFTYHKAAIAESMNFEIKLVVGWAVPEKNHKNIMDKNLRTALENTKLTVMLTLNNHNIDFNQDGSIIVTAEYHGRIEGLLEDDNKTSIFADSPEEKAARDAFRTKKNLSQTPGGQLANETLSFFGLESKSAVTQVKAFFESEDIGGLLTPEMKKLPWEEQLRILDKKYPGRWPELKNWLEHLQGKNELLEKKDIQEVKKLILQARKEKHVELMRLLEERAGIFSVLVNKKDMDDFLRVSGGNMGAWGTESKFGRKIPSPRILTGGISLQDMEYARLREKKKKIAAALLPSMAVPWKADATKESQQASVVGEDYQFSYIYLGDIIDAALEIISKKGVNPKTSRFRVVSGPLNYTNPKTGKIVKINLADVPISINIFMDWYTKNVIEEGIVKWPLIRFLRSIATNLIFPALGGSCYESAPPISRVGKKLAFNIFSTPLDFLEEYPREDIEHPDLAKKIKEANRRWHADISPEKIYDYVMLQSNFVKPVERNGNKLLDEKDGIFHLTLGRDSGIVKEISFSRNDMPYFFESRLKQENEIDRIKHPYNADIRMIGNTFFRPGMQLYIEPSMTAMGPANSKSSVVSKLGLGGYYVILGSSMKIEGTKFETSLRAVFNSFGFFESKKSKAVVTSDINAREQALNSLPPPDQGPAATPGQLAHAAEQEAYREEYKKQLAKFHKLRELKQQERSPLYDPSQPDIPLVISEQGRRLAPGTRPPGQEADPMAGYRFRD